MNLPPPLHFRRILTRAYPRALPFAIACSALLIIGACSQAVKSAEPVPDPEPAPLPTFIGTWSTTDGWYWEELGHIGTRRHTLTFTQDRFIEHTEHICDVSNCPVEDGEDDWTESGTWSNTDTTITKIWLDDDRLQKLPKRYFWNTSRTALLIHPWDSGGPEDSFREYTRVDDPGVILTGSWTWTSVNEDDGITHVFTYTFADDGTLTYNHQRTGAEDSLYTLIGTFTHDVEKHLILHTITDERVNGEEVSDGRNKGQTRRSAYAPTSDPTKIAMSPFWREQQWSFATMSWVDRIDNPYGDYWRLFQKQQ